MIVRDNAADLSEEGKDAKTDLSRQLEDQLVVRNGQSGIIAVDVGFAAGLVSVRLADAAVHNDE